MPAAVPSTLRPAQGVAHAVALAANETRLGEVRVRAAMTQVERLLSWNWRGSGSR